MPGSLSSEVLHFLRDNIDSVPHLEALLLLWQSLPAEWTATDVAARIYVPLSLSLSILEDLGRRGLTIPSQDSTRYAFNPGCPEAVVMPLVAAAYRSQLIAVSTFIHSKGPMSVREFARAFQFKGDPKK